MYTNQKKKGACVYDVTSYSMPKLHEGKKWFVDFLCFDPVEGRMRRKKYHLDGIRTARAKRMRAAELIANITERLRRGWNVWAESAESSRHYMLFTDVCNLYIRYLEKMARAGSLKESTRGRMLSYYKVWDVWLRKVQVRQIMYVYQIDAELVGDFLDYMLLDRDVSALTRNNYRTWLSTFCAWMVEKGFLAQNPVENIKNIPEKPKRRDALSSAELARLQSYLKKNNRHFLLACMMEYYTFIRPEELTHVRIGDIRVKEQKVVVSAEFSKNRRDGAVGLNAEVLRLMVDLGVFGHASGEYLFGGKDFRPGPQKIESRAFREEWAKVRRALGWPASYQFYSLKDTGIRDLANSAGIVVARDQARHSDISTTNRYLKADALSVHEEAKRFRGGLCMGESEE